MKSIKVSRIVLRFHGSFLIVLTTLLIIASIIGTFRGVGIFSWLQPIPLVHVGLFQAYSLMMVIGVVLWIGSFWEITWVWDLIGLLAHVPPLLASFIFADAISKIDLPSSVPLHSFFILLELVTIFYIRVSKTGHSIEAC